MFQKLRLRWRTVLVAVLAVVLLVMPALVGFAATQGNLGKEHVAEVILREERPLPQVLSEAKTCRVKVLGIYSTFQVGKLPVFTDFQKCEETDDISTVVEKLTTNRQQIIRLLQHSCKQMLQEQLCTKEGQIALQEVQHELIAAAGVLSDDVKNTEVKGLLVAGGGKEINMLSQRLNAEATRTIPSVRNDQRQNDQPLESSVMPAATPDPETWVPEEGYCV
ncbi:hypothetical protein [Thermodesulfitimonas sp.]